MLITIESTIEKTYVWRNIYFYVRNRNERKELKLIHVFVQKVTDIRRTTLRFCYIIKDVHFPLVSPRDLQLSSPTGQITFFTFGFSNSVEIVLTKRPTVFYVNSWKTDID